MLTGLAGGAVGGLMGVGGGIIMIPLLTWLGLSQKRAQGTSLSATVPLAIVGMLIYSRTEPFDPKAAILFATGGVIGAYFGTALVRHFSNRVLYRLFGLLLVAIAIRHAYTAVISASPEQASGDISLLLAGLAGIGGGLVSGFFGVGGGIVFVPAGVQLLGLGEKVAHGVSLAAIIPTALIGFFRYRAAGDLEARACSPLIAGAIVGGIISAYWATALANLTLAITFAVFLALIGLRRLIGRNPQGK